MLLGTVADSCPFPYLFQRGMVEASSERPVLFYIEQGSICYRVNRRTEGRWSRPVKVAEGSRDFSVCIDEKDNICLSYVRGNGLYFRKLSPWQQRWKPGKETEVTLGQSGCSYASIVLHEGTLWAAACEWKENPSEVIDGAYMMQDVPETYEYAMTIKRSNDEGRTWREGHSLRGESGSVPVLVSFGSKLACIYSQGLALKWLLRKDDDSIDPWEDRGEIVNDMIAIDLFNCCAANGKLHLMYKKSGIRHMLFDGAGWKEDPIPFSEEPMDSDAAMSSSRSGLWSFRSKGYGPRRSAVVARRWKGDGWGEEMNLSPPFDACLAFDGSVYRDITEAMMREASPPVPFGGKVDSALYFGSNLRFTGLNMSLSEGEGGSYSFESWNGEEWEEVIGLEDGTGGLATPGVVGFNALTNLEKNEVGGFERFWLRVRRTSPAERNPVIHRALPLGHVVSLATAATVHSFVPVAWVDATSLSSGDLLYSGIAADKETTD
jgi:hypothetical protein